MSEFYYFVQFFFIYGFLGWCTEVAFAAWKERTFVNRGFLNGPICPIYGFGVCSVVYLLKPFESTFIYLQRYPCIVTGMANRISVGKTVSSQVVGLFQYAPQFKRIYLFTFLINLGCVLRSNCICDSSIHSEMRIPSTGDLDNGRSCHS